MCRRVWVLVSSVAVAGGVALGGRADRAATVSSDRVNVRGSPSLSSEVVTQLQRGESIVVVESLKAERPGPREPTDWYRIRLPANTPVWVHTGFVAPSNRVVTASRLNVRAGPGENYSILGRLVRGEVVPEIRVLDDWMEIEPPADTFVYVASRYVSLQAETATQPAPSAKSPPTATAAAPPPSPAPPSVVAKANGPPTGAPKEERAGGPPSGTSPAPPPQPAPLATPAPGPSHAIAPSLGPSATPDAAPAGSSVSPRIIRREGIVTATTSIQAPTSYKLKSPDTRRDLNFLLPGSRQMRLAPFKGQRVVVTGEEQIDPRWPALPMIEVRKIELAP